jgi:hypothetical protein
MKTYREQKKKLTEDESQLVQQIIQAVEDPEAGNESTLLYSREASNDLMTLGKLREVLAEVDDSACIYFATADNQAESLLSVGVSATGQLIIVTGFTSDVENKGTEGGNDETI